MAGVIRVGLVDDHPVVLSGLDTALATVDDIEIVVRGGSLAEARAIASRDDIDVLLLDVRLPDGNGLELLDEVSRRGRPAVLILSSFRSRQYVAAALRFGASGFLLKTTPLEDLIAAIHVIANGGTAFTTDQIRDAQQGFVTLSQREREIIGLVLGGRSNDEIAVALRTSRKTVEFHLTRLYERFKVMTRVELALRADQEGWLDITSQRLRDSGRGPAA
jgi:Response regulator containing a CheY-like receiver domain and an HTH DNA-binding domain